MPHLVKILQILKNKNGPLVTIDIGANLGLFSYLLSKESESVIAIEPQPKLASYLKSVMPSQVTVMNLAVSDFTGDTTLNIPKIKGLFGIAAQQDALATIESSNPISSAGYIDSILVRVDTIDNVLSGFKRVDFIKIDVEGHEFSVLKGGLSVLNELRPFMMIELFKIHNPKVLECFDLLFNCNYICFYFSNSDVTICSNTDSVKEIINNPYLHGPVVQNFFFSPIEKFELIKNSI